MQTWQTELSTQNEKTANLYKGYFLEFCEYINQTPNEILTQRIIDDTSTDKPTKRRYETQFRQFLKYRRTKPKANGKTLMPRTMQTIYSAIRSFFELHEYPLKMRRKDYPKGKAIGVRRATKEHILKVLTTNPNNKKLTAILHTLNDTGLSASDTVALNCKIFLENPNAKIIMYQTLRQKTKDTIKTFFGEESITAIHNYLNQRRKGTRKIPPEQITPETPLFIQYKTQNPK
jgi:integrase